MSNQSKSQMNSGRFFLIFVLLLQQFLGGLSYPMAKYGLQQIEPFTFSFFRFTLSGIVLLVMNGLRKNRVRIEKKDYLKIMGLGFLIIFLNQATFLYGQRLTASGHGALLYATVPIWIFLGGLIFLKEKFIWRRAVGVGLGLIGVAFIIASGAIEFSREYLKGDLIILIAVLSWSLYTILGKPLVLKYGAFRVTAYALAFGSAMYFPFGLFRAINFDYAGVTPGSWIALVYMALGVSIVVYVLWYWLLKRMEVTRMAVFSNFQPVVASAVAFVFLGEPVTRSFVLGGIIVIAGVLVIEW